MASCSWDDESAPLADEIQAAFRGDNRQANALHHQHVLSRRPYRRNAYFQTQASIVAHDNVRKRFETGGRAGNGGSMHFDVKPLPKDALPVITHDRAFTFLLGTPMATREESQARSLPE
jgi:hypothetical protein